MKIESRDILLNLKNFNNKANNKLYNQINKIYNIPIILKTPQHKSNFNNNFTINNDNKILSYQIKLNFNNSYDNIYKSTPYKKKIISNKKNSKFSTNLYSTNITTMHFNENNKILLNKRNIYSKKKTVDQNVNLNINTSFISKNDYLYKFFTKDEEINSEDDENIKNNSLSLENESILNNVNNSIINNKQNNYFINNLTDCSKNINEKIENNNEIKFQTNSSNNNKVYKEKKENCCEINKCIIF